MSTRLSGGTLLYRSMKHAPMDERQQQCFEHICSLTAKVHLVRRHHFDHNGSAAQQEDEFFVARYSGCSASASPDSQPALFAHRAYSASGLLGDHYAFRGIVAACTRDDDHDNVYLIEEYIPNNEKPLPSVAKLMEMRGVSVVDRNSLGVFIADVRAPSLEQLILHRTEGCADRARFSSSEVLSVLVQLLLAANFLHTYACVHRFLWKTESILLRSIAGGAFLLSIPAPSCNPHAVIRSEGVLPENSGSGRSRVTSAGDIFHVGSIVRRMIKNKDVAVPDELHTLVDAMTSSDPAQRPSAAACLALPLLHEAARDFFASPAVRAAPPALCRRLNLFTSPISIAQRAYESARAVERRSSEGVLCWRINGVGAKDDQGRRLIEVSDAALLFTKVDKAESELPACMPKVSRVPTDETFDRVIANRTERALCLNMMDDFTFVAFEVAQNEGGEDVFWRLVHDIAFALQSIVR